jgi:hypothetical protein
VTLPRPRDVTSPEFNGICRCVASLPEDEANAAFAAAKLPLRPRASPFSTTFVSRPPAAHPQARNSHAFATHPG